MYSNFVGGCMTHQFFHGCEIFRTLLTLEVGPPHMPFYMFVEVAVLSESLRTALHSADIGSFLGVSSQVVEQVLPAWKSSRTTVMAADEDLSPSTRPLIKELYQLKLTRRRNIILSLYLHYFDILAFLNVDQSIIT